jgi:hypothetical protein
MNPNQQPQYRPNRTALWLNNRKQTANQPDLKGNVEITYALVQELLAAFNSGAYQADRGNQPCIKLDIALYLQQQGQSASGGQKPYLSGQLSTLAQTQQSAMLRQQAAQQYQQQPQPQAVQPQPQQAPQWPQQPQPAPMPQPMPQQPQPVPMPAPQQYAPQQIVFEQAQTAPAYQQQPQQPIPAPVPPPAPVPGIPGAIHAQLPAGF